VSVSIWAAAFLSVALATPARASCPGPRTQLGCGESGVVSPSCALAVYLAYGEKPSELAVGTGGDAGTPVAISVSTPETIKIEGHDPYYDPKTCELMDGTYSLSYVRVLLTPQNGWPLDQTLQVTAAGAAIASFRATTAGTCLDQRPVAGMCGSGWPAPVEGCPKGEKTEESGCSFAGPPGPGPLPLAVLAVLAALRARRKRSS
jgi:uncharacterized protein (TIGR03382 family)